MWAGAHTLGRDRTYWCLCLLTTHVRMVARSWSCMGAEPTAMLKTMLSTGSKVANSSLVGAAPAIKYHWPRWGSGNWRDKEGSRRRCLKVLGFLGGTWRRQWHPTPVLLPGKSHGQRNLAGCLSKKTSLLFLPTLNYVFLNTKAKCSFSKQLYAPLSYV